MYYTTCHYITGLIIFGINKVNISGSPVILIQNRCAVHRCVLRYFQKRGVLDILGVNMSSSVLGAKKAQLVLQEGISDTILYCKTRLSTAHHSTDNNSTITNHDTDDDDNVVHALTLPMCLLKK